MRAPRILVVGSANMDLVVKCSRMPLAGETVIGGEFSTVRGGKGANQAIACARLGAETWILGRLGPDAFGDQLLAGLLSDGVRCDFLSRDHAVPSGVAMIIIDSTGENSIVVAPGANMRITVQEVATAVETLQFDAVLCQLEVPLSAVAAAFQAGRDKGALTVLDAGPPQYLSPDLLSLVDVLSPNETEARAILGEAPDADLSPHQAAEHLLATGARNVVLKLGAEGALVANHEGTQHVPAFRVKPVDTTGAGDAFTAALTVALVEKGGSPQGWHRLPLEHLVSATRIAAAAGALAATVFGAAPSMPTRDRLEEFLRHPPD
jgi:ribokinase